MSIVLSAEDQNTFVSLLQQHNVISPTQIELALQIQKRKGESLEEILVRMGWVTKNRLQQILGKLWDIPVLEPKHLNSIDYELIKLIPEDLCRKYPLLPLYYQDNQLIVAMTDPFDLVAIDDLKHLIKTDAKPILGSEEEIIKAIGTVYNKEAQITKGTAVEEAPEVLPVNSPAMEGMEDFKLELAQRDGVEEEEEDVDANQLAIRAGDPPVVKMVNYMIVSAITDKASDIHVEPIEEGIQVRCRIDGDLFELLSAPKRLKSSVLSRLKILAGMDIAIKRVPQDGSFGTTYNGKEVDFRVNSLPTIYGEKIVLRLLEKNAVLNNKLGDLGMGDKLEEIFRNNIHRPHGMILVTGPTGSGKSTTLYTVLNEIRSPTKNIITVEDPAEYRLPGIQQVQVQSNIGFEFADALRAILRQDPDIIMIGEIRDNVTAQIAVKSALTGHLVLSTLHTNDAPGAILRLINIGIDPFLVSSSVTMAVAQRLVKRLCPSCKEKYKASDEEKEMLGVDNSENLFLYKEKGCDQCRNVGFKGRLAVFEVFEMNNEIKQILLSNSGMDAVREKAIKNGMVTLKQCGFQKALAGLTTVQEVLARCIEEE